MTGCISLWRVHRFGEGQSPWGYPGCASEEGNQGGHNPYGCGFQSEIDPFRSMDPRSQSTNSSTIEEESLKGPKLAFWGLNPNDEAIEALRNFLTSGVVPSELGLGNPGSSLKGKTMGTTASGNLAAMLLTGDDDTP